MPSAPMNHVSMSGFPSQREGDTNVIVAKMDGVVRKASNAVAGNTTRSPDLDPDFVEEDDELPAALSGRQPDKHSTDYIIRSGIAGGLAGCTAKTTVAPLDRVKILFQTGNPHFRKYTSSWVGVVRAMGDIYAHDGVVGLFRGHSATLLKIYPYAAIKFVAYEQYRAFIIGGKHQETWIRRFSSGALAGVTSVFFTYPLEVIRVRLAFETKHRSSSLTAICKKIYNEQPRPKSPLAALESGSRVTKAIAGAATSTAQAVAPRTGLINFYRGFSTTMIGMVPYAGMSFLTHDTVGDILRHPSISSHTMLPKPANSPPDKPPPLRAWAQLIAGGLSGAVSQTVSYPLEVIRRRMQVSGAVGDGRRLRIGETASMIFRERGIPGFFVGLTIGYVKVVPLVAVSFYTYERMKAMFNI